MAAYRKMGQKPNKGTRELKKAQFVPPGWRGIDWARYKSGEFIGCGARVRHNVPLGK
jgi:hypothetical protein